MNQSTRSKVGLLLVCAVCCLAVVVAFSQQDSESVVDPDVYEDFMSAQVQDVYDLETFFFAQQDAFLPIIPPDPDFTLRQTADQPLPFDLKSFPPEFTEGLVYEYENSVPVFPVTVLEDPFTHETVFLNAEGKELYALPPAAGYDPYSYLKWLMPDLYSGSYSTEEVYYWQRLYSPDRIQSVVRLIPTENVEPYLYVAAKIQEAQAALAASSGGGIGLLRSEYSESNINFEVIARTNGVRMIIGYPDDFTNRLDVYMCNDLMQYVWAFAVKELSTTGTNEITWVDTNYWVASGPSVRFYSAGNADLDTDGDGYADAREIMVFRTSETDSNSRPIRISGTVSYSGIETGTIWVLSTTVTDSWSIAQSVSLSGPGVYSNDIGNNQSYWFKAFRDVNSSYVRDAWEPWGVYSSSSTLITGDTSGLDITLQDQPSLWGAVDFLGAETGNVWVVAVTASDSWSTAYSSMLPWTQGGDPMTGGVAFLTFPASFSITQLPVSNYWIRAFIDEDYDGAYTEGEIAGQYTSNAIPVSNRITGLNFTLDQDADSDGLPDWWEWQHGTDANNPDTDGDGFGDGDEVNTYSTDPLDKYSVPPLPMLTASGKYLVDASTNAIVIKSVNVGAWLQWEQWMLMFEPHLWTNDWGKVYGLKSLGAADETDEAAAREMLVANVDHSVTLLATNAPLKSGVTVGSSWGWLCENGIGYVGDFHNGDYIAFTNVDFGAGVSNLAIALAVPDYDAGEQITVRLTSPSGPVIGTLTTTATAYDVPNWDEWCAFAEQYIALSTNLTGTQSVYFVGSAASGAIANLYRFRFFNDATNTANLFETFRDNYISTNDLDMIQERGYNCIRLPFFHTILEDDNNPYVYKDSGWERLDWVIEQCRIRHLWVILDLHSTPGGQNPYHASGYRDPFRNRMWMSEHYRDRTEKLWAAIAARYATNSTVAGYDLFNEPAPYTGSGWTTAQAFSNNIVPMLTRLHRAIRSNDTQHVLFMESNLMYTNMWAGDYLWWPAPAAQGWTNVAYEFHVYDRTVYGTTGSDEDSYFTTQKGICDTMIRAFTQLREQKNVPIYVGEYAPWNEQNFDYWTRQLQANDFHWGHWNYRSWGWDNSSKPEEGKTLWGLDYRSKETTNQAPDLVTDDLDTLVGKMALYNWDSYTDNEPLQDVVAQHATDTALSKGKCDFYLNTFSAPNSYTLNNGWPWRKVSAVGSAENFRVLSSQARVYLNAGTPVMRFRSRQEADARFAINDASGCSFSADVAGFNVTTPSATGAEARVALCAVRDSISKSAYEYDTVGIVGLMEYEQSNSTVRLLLYSKNGGTNTYGILLDFAGPISFATGATMRLVVNEDDASLAYNGTNYCTGAHTNLALNAWPDGAVCVVEAGSVAGATTSYADLDNFRAWRDDAATDALYEDRFSAYPDGIEIRAETEYLNAEDYSAASRKTASFATNAHTFWIPKEWAKGGTWLSPRRDYHNGVRIPASPTQVVEARAAYTDFTDGIAKICLLPEYFPTEIYNEYEGQALYVDVERRTNDVKFTARRHDGTSSRQDLQTNYVANADGQTISLQANTNALQVFYGTNLVINVAHGLAAFTNVYANGVCPHYEFQNNWTTNAYVLIGGVSCRQSAAFAPPEE